MFKKELQKNFEKIFEGMKVTFNAPSDKFEQDTVFINISQAQSRPMKEKFTARVTGFIQIFAEHEKLPFGFMGRKIEQADFEYTKNLHFSGLDTENAASPARMVNLSERQAQFVFLFSQQYDPNQGTINQVTMEGNFSA